MIRYEHPNGSTSDGTLIDVQGAMQGHGLRLCIAGPHANADLVLSAEDASRVAEVACSFWPELIRVEEDTRSIESLIVERDSLKEDNEDLKERLREARTREVKARRARG